MRHYLFILFVCQVFTFHGLEHVDFILEVDGEKYQEEGVLSILYHSP